jgi:hypothetical protein
VLATSRRNRLTGAPRGAIVQFSDFSARGDAMSFDELLLLASRDERFMATVYAMNTLLIHKGIYTRDEFEALFAEWMKKHGTHAKPATTSEAALAASSR